MPGVFTIPDGSSVSGSFSAASFVVPPDATVGIGNASLSSRLTIGANDAHTVRTLLEAEAYPGPSIVIAYSHCIAHGYDMAKGAEHQQNAVKSGYWPLFRYNPIKKQGERFVLDSKEPTLPVGEFMYQENRFKVIQNKLHFAVHGQTAPELILRRADASQPHMGLSTWKGTQVTKADVGTAKNYLRDAEIGELNRIVTMWLDFAEDQALRRKEIFLKDWAERLDAFLNFNERQVLTGAGTVSHKDAVAHAEGQYERFAAQRRATLEAEGEAYAARVLAAPAADEAGVEELGQVAKRLTKKKANWCSKWGRYSITINLIYVDFSSLPRTLPNIHKNMPKILAHSF